MAEPYIGEIRLLSFDWVPRGWALCDGKLLPIQQNMALYSLLGIQFGGDGKTTFALPDLRGRVPVGADPRYSSYKQGAALGREGVALTSEQTPQHTHVVQACAVNGTSPLATGACLANPVSAAAGSTTPFPAYLPNADSQTATALAPLIANSVGVSGSGQAHANMQPSTVVNFCIALTGYYPPRD